MTIRRFPAPGARVGPVRPMRLYVSPEPEIELPSDPVRMTPAQQARQDAQCELLRRAIAGQNRPLEDDGAY